MKFRIKFTFISDGEVVESEMLVWAEDVRYALRLVETDLDVLGARVESVVPLQSCEEESL